MDNTELLMGQEDYWAGYQASIDKLKNDPNVVEFDKLCFYVFGLSEEGKTLLDYFKNNILMASIPAKLDSNYDKACIYYEGYREAFRQLIHGTKNYQIRKEAEDKKKIQKAAEGESS